MKRQTYIGLLIIGCLTISALLCVNAWGQEPPIKISLLTTSTTYQPGDPVGMQIDVYNNSGAQVITRKGFSNKDFHLMLTFTDPDGKTITTKYIKVSDDPLPPYRYMEQDAALIEIFQDRTLVIADARDYYKLTKFGRYTAKVVAAVETFSSAHDSDGDEIVDVAYLADRASFGEGGAIESNKVIFEIASPIAEINTAVKVNVSLLTVGSGAKPPTKKVGLDGVPVCLIPRSQLAEYEPINWKVYPVILGNDVDCLYSGTTAAGSVSFDNVVQDDYLVLARHESQTMGSSIGAADLDWGSGGIIEKNLIVMQRIDGKKMPGKTTKRTGSLLLIHEPEYVEWNSDQEYYPFVFESIGDWGVVTSVAPPEGFVADYDALSAEVSSEIEAVQFTITDIGSKWEETGVTFTLKHKNKTEKFTSKIGVKLSKKLANAKGLGEYGHTKDPGLFVGGKKKDKND